MAELPSRLGEKKGPDPAILSCWSRSLRMLVLAPFIFIGIDAGVILAQTKEDVLEFSVYVIELAFERLPCSDGLAE